MARSSGCCLSSATRHRRICVEWGHLLQTGAGVAASIRLALCKHHRAAAIPVAADPCSNCKDRPARRSDRCWDTVGLRRRPGREIAPCASACSPRCPCCPSRVPHSPSRKQLRHRRSAGPGRPGPAGWFATRGHPGDRCGTFRSPGAGRISEESRSGRRLASPQQRPGPSDCGPQLARRRQSHTGSHAGHDHLLPAVRHRHGLPRLSSGGQTLRFGVAGLLCTSDVLRYDRETEPHGRHCLL